MCKTFRDLKIGDKLFFVDFGGYTFSAYEIIDIVNYSDDDDEIKFCTAIIVGNEEYRTLCNYFNLYKCNLDLSISERCTGNLYADEELAISKLIYDDL